jgi:hypothetical protein
MLKRNVGDLAVVVTDCAASSHIIKKQNAHTKGVSPAYSAVVDQRGVAGRAGVMFAIASIMPPHV